MKIIQLVPSLLYGDAIGNDVVAIKKILADRGFKTQIYADCIDERVKNEARNLSDVCDLQSDDIILYHEGCFSKQLEWVKEQNCRKVMIYHNITPSEFFSKYNKTAEDSCRLGYDDVRKMNDVFDFVLAVSSFNKQNLVDMGYKCPMKVLPILIPFDDYKKVPSQKILVKYKNDGFTNIVFVGRISPNKCQQDVIKAFCDYQRYFNKKSRLFIVGSGAGCETYEQQLKEYSSMLGARNVIFTGHIKFDEILAYYHLADLFLCQSEHEGFCVPLVEAMYFNVPIVAYDSSAIGETLGGSGVLLKEKDSLLTAGVIDRIVTDADLRKTIIENQCERLQDFQYDKVKDLFWKYMDEFIKQEE